MFLRHYVRYGINGSLGHHLSIFDNHSKYTTNIVKPDGYENITRQSVGAIQVAGGVAGFGLSPGVSFAPVPVVKTG